ncbi:MAG: S41 family peptidase [Bryobacteraceae bacterium]|jgi:carboxyl-terminal processing protease
MLLPLLFLFAAPAPAPAADDVESSLRRFTEVLATVESRAADPIDSERAVYDGAIPAMLRELDPHSVFFDPEQFEQLKTMERSETKGFGSVVSVLPGRVIVLQALPGTPSSRAGLSPGDEIVVINNVPLAALSFDQLVQFLGESHQKQAELLVRRPGSVRPLRFTLRPELIDAPSVDRAFLLQPGIGYVRVASFDPKTAKSLKDAIEKLGGGNLKGLVLDLRNNTGGVVQTAMESASFFLKAGQRILTAHGRSVQGNQEVDVPKNASPYSFPLAVLVNERTASAAEIVTGALQDHDRATIVGMPTYGKGLVQSVLPLSGNTAMALTTAFYYTPSGRSIQRPLREGQLGDIAAHSEYSTDSGRKVPGGGGIQPDVVVAPEAQDRLRVALEASGALTSFATDYTQKHELTDPFEVTGDVLDDFQLYASERAIRPAVAEWLRERDWIQARLRTEIYNQAFGVARGDEVEAQSDPQVKAAVAALVR